MPKDTHSSTQESDFIKIDNLVSTAFSLQYKVYEGLEFAKIKFSMTRFNLYFWDENVSKMNTLQSRLVIRLV
jgi:hypothetical protein